MSKQKGGHGKREDAAALVLSFPTPHLNAISTQSTYCGLDRLTVMILFFFKENAINSILRTLKLMKVKKIIQIAFEPMANK